VAVAEALLAAVADPVTVGRHRLQISLSVGVMVSPTGDLRTDALLDAADRGLHRAKVAGRHRWAFQSLDVPPPDPSP
jgi:GGDEF domain-containing protein